MVEAVDKARAARTWSERLAARIPGFSGYLERELRREVDQMVRAELAVRLDRARDGVQVFQRRLRLDQPGLVQRLAALDRRLDQLGNTLRHAGSGYAGMLDAVKVRGAELDALVRFDLALTEGVDAVLETARALGDEAGLARLEAQLSAVAEQVGNREAVVRSVLGV